MLRPAGSAVEWAAERGPYIAPRAASSAGSCGASGRPPHSAPQTSLSSEESGRAGGARRREGSRGLGRGGAVHGPALCCGPWLLGARPRVQFVVDSAENAPCKTGGLACGWKEK